jgi:hypothetical protein
MLPPLIETGEGIKVSRRKQEHRGMDGRSGLDENIERRFEALAGITSGDVPIMLIGFNFTPEVMTAGEGFDVKELGFLS